MTLTDLFISTLEEQQAAQANETAQEAALLTKKQQKAVEQLESYLGRWWPLRATLGLKGTPEVGHNRALLRGQTLINNLPVETAVWTDLPRYKGDQVSLTISVKSQQFPDVVNTIGIGDTVDGAEYPRRLGLLCSAWMENYARAAAEYESTENTKAAALSTARKIVELSKVYQERMGLYTEECRRWAQAEAAKLWVPHTLWRVRYVPVVSLGTRDEQQIQTLVVMEEPAAIVNALRQFPTVTVSAVDPWGRVEKREIPSFLDARRLDYTAHDCERYMNHHRTITTSTGICLNIPAHETREPVPPPPFPGWAAFLDEVDPELVSPWQDEDYTRLAAMMPESLLKHYLQVWTE